MSETGLPGVRAIRNQRLLVGFCLLFALLAAFVGLFLAVNLMLLQLIFYKTGPRNAIVCGVISLVLMTGTRFVAYRFLTNGIEPVMAFDLAVPALSVLALFLLNLRIGGVVAPSWMRVILAYGLFALFLTPVANQVFADPQIMSVLTADLTALGKGMGVELFDASLIDFSLAVLIRSGALGMTLFVLFCWYAATRFQRRLPVQWYAALALANFRIAEYVVWPLLASLAAFGAARVVPLPDGLDMAISVFMLGMVLLYFLQGLGIIVAWFGRHRNPGMQRLGLPLVLAILFLAPVANLVLLVVIPLLGVLELWIRMRPATHDEKDATVDD